MLKSLLTEEQKEEYTRTLSASLPPEAATGQLLEAGEENKVRRTVVFRVRIGIHTQYGYQKVNVEIVGYSNYDVFLKKMIGVHGYIGVKSNSKTIL